MGTTGIVLVCCPLISLMKDQIERANAIEGVTAAQKGKSPELDRDILDGKIDIVFGSPEVLLDEQRESLGQMNVSTIVIDEFHLISTWGQDDKEQRKKAFRKWFGELGELRSLFPNATLLALSATCTLKVQQRVMKAVMFRHNYTYVYVSPDKRNIKFVIKKSPNDVEMAFTWLVDGLLQGNTFPRILVYCKSIGEVAKIYDYITDELPDHLKCSISMFHSETEEMVKEHVLSSISDSESELRVIVSTNALGMGVDFKKLSGIILYGPPNSMLDVVQEIGRAGRDGEKAVAILVHNSHHLRQCDPDVKKLYQKNECRRLSMMESFLKEDELEKLKSNIGDCTCCDICQATCTCGDCSLLPLEKLFLGDSSVDEVESDNPDDDDFSDDAELEDIDLGDYD